MDTTTLIIFLIAIGIVAVLAIVAFGWRERQSRNLRDDFGDEYDRTVRDAGSRGKAERELASRKKRVEQFDIRDLSRDEREQYRTRWHDLQAEFVDDPERAVRGADSLIEDVMRARGYPTGDFDKRAADVSVDHPGVVQDYRKAHTIVETYDKGGDVTTDHLRMAVQRYRNLFDDLVGEDGTSPTRQYA
jgi:FtsZ-interacting cell division protein ZipA